MSLLHTRMAANIPVNDMSRALKFYGEILGLKTIQFIDWAAGVMTNDGAMAVMSLRATPQQTDNDILNFTVGDIKTVIKELKSKGVKFEDYDLPYLKTSDHVAERDGYLAAWFRDSEGNLLQLNQSPVK